MESADIKSVLYRASLLQSKLDNAISRASTAEEGKGEELDSEDHENAAESLPRSNAQKKNDRQTLGSIRRALDDLHSSLHSFQDLQKRQNSERENLLVDLDERRDILIRRLQEYNGTEWEIIEEAHAFVGVPVQRKDDLVLPPYQVSIGRIPDVSHLSSPHQSSSSERVSLVTKPGDNDANGGDVDPTAAASSSSDDGDANNASDSHDKMGNDDYSESGVSMRSHNFLGFRISLPSLATRVARVVGFSAKNLLVLSGVITIFALSHCQPRFRACSTEKSLKKMQPSGTNLNNEPSPLDRKPLDPNKGVCPPGKIWLVHDGVEKCFVKERIEAPFKEVFKQPDASYGYG